VTSDAFSKTEVRAPVTAAPRILTTRSDQVH
jgi:hypothetical protein